MRRNLLLASGVSLEIVIYFFVTCCNSFTLPEPELPGISGLAESKRQLFPTPQMQCYYNNTYYIGDIPSTATCHSYYTCAPSGTIPGGTEQTHRNCGPGHDGKPLIYDIKNCHLGCRSIEEGAVCFDENNEEHLQYFYSCSQPYNPIDWP